MDQKFTDPSVIERFRSYTDELLQEIKTPSLNPHHTGIAIGAVDSSVNFTESIGDKEVSFQLQIGNFRYKNLGSSSEGMNVENQYISEGAGHRNSDGSLEMQRMKVMKIVPTSSTDDISQLEITNLMRKIARNFLAKSSYRGLRVIGDRDCLLVSIENLVLNPKVSL